MAVRRLFLLLLVEQALAAKFLRVHQKSVDADEQDDADELDSSIPDVDLEDAAEPYVTLVNAGQDPVAAAPPAPTATAPPAAAPPAPVVAPATVPAGTVPPPATVNAPPAPAAGYVDPATTAPAGTVPPPAAVAPAAGYVDPATTAPAGTVVPPAAVAPPADYVDPATTAPAGTVPPAAVAPPADYVDPATATAPPHEPHFAGYGPVHPAGGQVTPVDTDGDGDYDSHEHAPAAHSGFAPPIGEKVYVPGTHGAHPPPPPPAAAGTGVPPRDITVHKVVDQQPTADFLRECKETIHRFVRPHGEVDTSECGEIEEADDRDLCYDIVHGVASQLAHGPIRLQDGEVVSSDEWNRSHFDFEAACNGIENQIFRSQKLEQPTQIDGLKKEDVKKAAEHHAKLAAEEGGETAEDGDAEEGDDAAAPAAAEGEDAAATGGEEGGDEADAEEGEEADAEKAE